MARGVETCLHARKVSIGNLSAERLRMILELFELQHGLHMFLHPEKYVLLLRDGRRERSCFNTNINI
jgi:hypothetical protein